MPRIEERVAHLANGSTRSSNGSTQSSNKFTWLVGLQVAGLIAVVGALAGSYYK